MRESEGRRCAQCPGGLAEPAAASGGAGITQFGSCIPWVCKTSQDRLLGENNPGEAQGREWEGNCVRLAPSWCPLSTDQHLPRKIRRPVLCPWAHHSHSGFHVCAAELCLTQVQLWQEGRALVCLAATVAEGEHEEQEVQGICADTSLCELAPVHCKATTAGLRRPHRYKSLISG